jgi:MFS family permease
VAEIVSVAGDQFARLGLSVLVFGRTGSAAWAAATYALTFLPALVGGVLLGRLADRRPRRRVMLACDLARAVLVALMALPGTPLPVLCALLVAVVLLARCTAAQGALLPEVVPGSVFEAALTLRYVTGQVAQVGGSRWVGCSSPP